MKKNLLSVIALTLAAAGLASSLVMWNALNQCRIEIAALTMQMNAMTATTVAPDPGETTLTAEPRADGSVGMTMTLASGKCSDDANASLIVMLDDMLVSQVPCYRNGDVCTATTAIPLNNGYTYILAYSGWEYLIASPENGAYPEFVNLADSMNAYGNLVLGDWIVLDNRLTLDVCHIQVQLPLLSTQDAPSSLDVRLILRQGGNDLDAVEVPLGPGEGQASFESTIHELSLALPVLAEGEEVTLWMEAQLANGQVISAWGGSWTATADGFVMAAG